MKRFLLALISFISITFCASAQKIPDIFWRSPLMHANGNYGYIGGDSTILVSDIFMNPIFQTEKQLDGTTEYSKLTSATLKGNTVFFVIASYSGNVKAATTTIGVSYLPNTGKSAISSFSVLNHATDEVTTLSCAASDEGLKRVLFDNYVTQLFTAFFNKQVLLEKIHANILKRVDDGIKSDIPYVENLDNGGINCEDGILLNCKTKDAKIFYSLGSGDWCEYKSAIPVDSYRTEINLQYYSSKEGLENSEVENREYMCNKDNSEQPTIIFKDAKGDIVSDLNNVNAIYLFCELKTNDKNTDLYYSVGTSKDEVPTCKYKKPFLVLNKSSDIYITISAKKNSCKTTTSKTQITFIHTDEAIIEFSLAPEHRILISSHIANSKVFYNINYVDTIEKPIPNLLLENMDELKEDGIKVNVPDLPKYYFIISYKLLVDDIEPLYYQRMYCYDNGQITSTEYQFVVN